MLSYQDKDIFLDSFREEIKKNIKSSMLEGDANTFHFSTREFVLLLKSPFMKELKEDLKKEYKKMLLSLFLSFIFLILASFSLGILSSKIFPEKINTPSFGGLFLVLGLGLLSLSYKHPYQKKKNLLQKGLLSLAFKNTKEIDSFRFGSSSLIKESLGAFLSFAKSPHTELFLQNVLSFGGYYPPTFEAQIFKKTRILPFDRSVLVGPFFFLRPLFFLLNIPFRTSKKGEIFSYGPIYIQKEIRDMDLRFLPYKSSVFFKSTGLETYTDGDYDILLQSALLNQNMRISIRENFHGGRTLLKSEPMSNRDIIMKQNAHENLNDAAESIFEYLLKKHGCYFAQIKSPQMIFLTSNKCPYGCDKKLFKKSYLRKKNHLPDFFFTPPERAFSLSHLLPAYSRVMTFYFLSLLQDACLLAPLSMKNNRKSDELRKALEEENPYLFYSLHELEELF